LPLSYCHVIVLNESHLRRLIRSYISYYIQIGPMIHAYDSPAIRPASLPENFSAVTQSQESAARITAMIGNRQPRLFAIQCLFRDAPKIMRIISICMQADFTHILHSIIAFLLANRVLNLHSETEQTLATHGHFIRPLNLGRRGMHYSRKKLQRKTIFRQLFSKYQVLICERKRNERLQC
jgi:hypothetical protein